MQISFAMENTEMWNKCPQDTDPIHKKNKRFVK